jgi:outer membrane murein-binding lipoprotein Lpp
MSFFASPAAGQMAGQSAMNFVGGVVATIGAKRASAAARAQALAEVDRLHREMEYTRESFRAAKEDRAARAEYEMGTMLAAMADNGGAGTLNASRFAGEISYYKGVDIGRLEANRMQSIGALKSQQVAANQRALNVQAQAWRGATSAWLKMGGDAVKSYWGAEVQKGQDTGSFGAQRHPGNSSLTILTNEQAEYEWR